MASLENERVRISFFLSSEREILSLSLDAGCGQNTNFDCRKRNEIVNDLLPLKSYLLINFKAVITYFADII